MLNWPAEGAVLSRVGVMPGDYLELKRATDLKECTVAVAATGTKLLSALQHLDRHTPVPQQLFERACKSMKCSYAGCFSKICH